VTVVLSSHFVTKSKTNRRRHPQRPPRQARKVRSGESQAAQLKVSNVLPRIEALEKYVNGLGVIPSTSYVGTAVILALLSKSLTVARAVCVLVATGFPAEAFGLTRTLVELYLTVHYITNKETETRAKTYVEYFAKVHAEWGEINAKYYPGRAVREPAFHDEAMKIAEKFKNKHAWTGVGGQTRMMAMEEDAFDVGDDGKPFRSEFDYEVIYFWTSHFVHGTVIAMEDHAVEARDIFRVRAGRRRQYLGDNALFNVLAFIVRAFVCALRAMREDQPSILNEIQEQLRVNALNWKPQAAAGVS